MWAIAHAHSHVGCPDRQVFLHTVTGRPNHNPATVQVEYALCCHSHPILQKSTSVTLLHRSVHATSCHSEWVAASTTRCPTKLTAVIWKRSGVNVEATGKNCSFLFYINLLHKRPCALRLLEFFCQGLAVDERVDFRTPHLRPPLPSLLRSNGMSGLGNWRSQCLRGLAGAITRVLRAARCAGSSEGLGHPVHHRAA
jgi:hypothetical protein